MVLPFSLPDWVPWWVNLVILLPSLLFLLAFIFMPFSVIGVKARLEGIEMRLDEIQGEIRSLALRLPEHASYLDDGLERPPIPPSAQQVPARSAVRERARPAEPPPRERTEPRLR